MSDQGQQDSGYEFGDAERAFLTPDPNDIRALLEMKPGEEHLDWEERVCAWLSQLAIIARIGDFAKRKPSRIPLLATETQVEVERLRDRFQVLAADIETRERLAEIIQIQADANDRAAQQMLATIRRRGYPRESQEIEDRAERVKAFAQQVYHLGRSVVLLSDLESDIERTYHGIRFMAQNVLDFKPPERERDHPFF